MRQIQQKLIELLTTTNPPDKELAENLWDKISRGEMLRIVNLEGIRHAHKSLKAAFKNKASIF